MWHAAVRSEATGHLNLFTYTRPCTDSAYGSIRCSSNSDKNLLCISNSADNLFIIETRAFDGRALRRVIDAGHRASDIACETRYKRNSGESFEHISGDELGRVHELAISCMFNSSASRRPELIIRDGI